MGKQSNYKKYKDEILQLLKEGQSVSQISKRLDFNYNNLRRYLINHRYIKKGRWISPHSDKKNEVIKLFNQGCQFSI